MKKYFILLPMALGFLISCSSPKQFEAGRPRHIVRGDTTTTIEYYETDFEARQKSYYDKMLGTWEVVSMRRQQKAELEELSNLSLQFNDNFTFSTDGECDSRGSVTIKGTSIRFSSLSASTCAADEKENFFLNLLQNRVSAYTVSGDRIFLRDGSSNIVFELKRR